MKRSECMKILLKYTNDIPLVLTTGYTCREVYSLQDRTNHFYMVGSMGMAASIGIGLAINNPDPVIVVDGDGSVLMNPSNLFLATTLKLNNLIHILIDNHSYESTGGQKSNSEQFDFQEIALSIGYKKAYTIDNLLNFEEALLDSLKVKNGPILLWVRVESIAQFKADRIEVPLNEITKRFRTYYKESRYTNA